MRPDDYLRQDARTWLEAVNLQNAALSGRMAAADEGKAHAQQQATAKSRR